MVSFIHRYTYYVCYVNIILSSVAIFKNFNYICLCDHICSYMLSNPAIYIQLMITFVSYLYESVVIYMHSE